MRKISIDDLGGGTSRTAPGDAGDLAKVLGKLGKGLTEIQSLSARMDSAEATNAQMLKVCNEIKKFHESIERRLSAVDRYLKDHADTHRDMNNSHGTQVSDLVKLVRNTTGQFSALQDMVAGALTDMAKRRDIPVVLETRVNAPAVTVQNAVNVPAEVEREPESFTFDIKRNPGGLIQSVVARPSESA